MSDDTALSSDLDVIEVEPVDMLGGLDLGALLGGIMPGMSELLAEVADPDRVTLDDIDEAIGDVISRLDWLITAVVEVVAKAPAKVRPTLPPRPE